MLLGSRSAIRRVSDSSSRALCLFTSPILRDGSSQASQSAPASRPDEQTPSGQEPLYARGSMNVHYARRVVMNRLMNRNRALPRLAAAPVKTALLCTAAFITTGAIADTPAAQSINVRYT